MKPKILVPVDATSHSALLPVATNEARWRGAELVLLRVVSSSTQLPPDVPARPTESGATLLARSARASRPTST